MGTGGGPPGPARSSIHAQPRSGVAPPAASLSTGGTGDQKASLRVSDRTQSARARSSRSRCSVKSERASQESFGVGVPVGVLGVCVRMNKANRLSTSPCAGGQGRRGGLRGPSRWRARRQRFPVSTCTSCPLRCVCEPYTQVQLREERKALPPAAAQRCPRGQKPPGHCPAGVQRPNACPRGLQPAGARALQRLNASAGQLLIHSCPQYSCVTSGSGCQDPTGSHTLHEEPGDVQLLRPRAGTPTPLHPIPTHEMLNLRPGF